MKNQNLAPIVLFTYKRLDTLKRTVTALQNNYLASESELFIFSDGYKNENDRTLVLSVRDYLKTISGFKTIQIFESQNNKGLANSIIQGVSFIFETHDNVIVLEDDLITTPNFLNFMNQALHFYNINENIFTICGYSFDLNIENYEYDSYILNRTWPWSWATWRNRWVNIDWDVKDYPEFKKNRKLRRKFSNLGSDVNDMLDRQMKGKIDSWAIRWTYHQFKLNLLSVYPNQSKIDNLGFDQLSTHTSGSRKRYLPVLDKSQKTMFIFQPKHEISFLHQKKFQQKMGILSRIKSKLETYFMYLQKIFNFEQN